MDVDLEFETADEESKGTSKHAINPIFAKLDDVNISMNKFGEQNETYGSGEELYECLPAGAPESRSGHNW